MLDDLELSLMAFPQSWTAATHTLAVNLLVLPVGNPLGPVGSVAKFAGTTLRLNARLITGEALPASGTTAALTVPFAAVAPRVPSPCSPACNRGFPPAARSPRGKSPPLRRRLPAYGS
jgi:hypothetical protein